MLLFLASLVMPLNITVGRGAAQPLQRILLVFLVSRLPLLAAAQAGG